ncbi:hypothetical protein TNCV_3180481 [Trichonephila clavipes]|nr:hypothetical protein TNCV_3180481 [Trichonephila clavipes]
MSSRKKWGSGSRGAEVLEVPASPNELSPSPPPPSRGSPLSNPFRRFLHPPSNRSLRFRPSSSTLHEFTCADTSSMPLDLFLPTKDGITVTPSVWLALVREFSAIDQAFEDGKKSNSLQSKDLSGEIIQGTFYPQELQKSIDSGFYPVEKVIRTRKKGMHHFLSSIPTVISLNLRSSVTLSSTPENYKVEGKDGEVVNAHYTRPHYVPVIRQQFQTVEGNDSAITFW